MPTTAFNNSYLAEIEQFDRIRAATEPSWLREMRQDAFARFTALGFPTTRDEEWRFTNVAPIADGNFRLAENPGRVDAAELSPFRFAPSGVVEIVFVDGRFAPGLSHVDGLPAGLSVCGLADVLSRDASRVASHLGAYARFGDQPFGALNTAFTFDGALVETSPNAVVELPVHIVFVGSAVGQMTHPRVLVLAGRNSQVRIVESYVGAGGKPGPSFTNAVSEIALGDGAVVDHYRVQRETPHAFHVSTMQVQLSQSATFSSHSFSFGGALVRNDLNARLAGEGADCTLNGLYLSDGSRLVDNHTFIDHARPHCSSHQVYKGILGGRARGVFNGKILVRPDAQKTDAKQTNKTLLLSDDAQINTKPQLEIFANDVKCTHGATVGQLSADALFYLQARGIDRATAQQMLVRAFAGDITGRVRIESLREHLDALVLRSEAARGGSLREEAQA